MALAKAPKPLLETQSMELVSRRKAGGQRTGELSFVTGHTHQCFFSLSDDVEHLLKLVLLSWLTAGKNHRLPSQCVRQELSGPCVNHLIAGIPKCFSKRKCKGSKKLWLQKRKFRFVHNLKRTKERKLSRDSYNGDRSTVHSVNTASRQHTWTLFSIWGLE